MSKAEERALEHTGYCRNQAFNDFHKGYRKAEKDLALTWEDIKEIDELTSVCFTDCEHGDSSKEIYQEVLRRFNEKRKEK